MPRTPPNALVPILPLPRPPPPVLTPEDGELSAQLGTSRGGSGRRNLSSRILWLKVADAVINSLHYTWHLDEWTPCYPLAVPVAFAVKNFDAEECEGVFEAQKDIGFRLLEADIAACRRRLHANSGTRGWFISNSACFDNTRRNTAVLVSSGIAVPVIVTDVALETLQETRVMKALRTLTVDADEWLTTAVGWSFPPQAGLAPTRFPTGGNVRRLADSFPVRSKLKSVCGMVWDYCRGASFGEARGARGKEQYGGYSVTSRKLIIACGRAYMRSDVLDAAMITLREDAAGHRPRTYLLLSGKMENIFMAGSSRRNDLAVKAARDIAEIAGDVDELVGLLSIGDSHWLPGVVHITSRKLVCIDAMEASGLTVAKHRLCRLGDAVAEREAGLLSAAERLPRPRSLFKPAAAKTENPIAQGDAVNCGAFVLAHAARIIEGGDAPAF